MKKTMLALGALALVLVLLGGALVWGLFSRLNPPREERPDLETYLAQAWPLFRLRSWDPEAGTLELDYPLRFTYAQMEKYGGTLEELRDLPAGNRATVADLKTTLREATGLTARSVTVYGLTTDGQTAYTLAPDGSVTACWDP